MCFCLKKQLSGGVISDPDPILTPKIASKNFCKAVFLFLNLSTYILIIVYRLLKKHRYIL